MAVADPNPDVLAPQLGVSHETAERLVVYVGELRRWQRVRNLVGRSTLDDVWVRHIADSLQLANLAEAPEWVDLGTGAGLPGLVLAIGNPDIHVHLIESDGRKCAFLREVARLTSARVTVWDDRVENALPRLAPTPGIVVSRALAPLTSLLALARSLLTTGAVGLFPKGRDHDAELTQARRSWRFACDVLPSRTDPEGRILRISDLKGPLQPANLLGDDRKHG